MLFRSVRRLTLRGANGQASCNVAVIARFVARLHALRHLSVTNLYWLAPPLIDTVPAALIRSVRLQTLRLLWIDILSASPLDILCMVLVCDTLIIGGCRMDRLLHWSKYACDTLEVNRFIVDNISNHFVLARDHLTVAQPFFIRAVKHLYVLIPDDATLAMLLYTLPAHWQATLESLYIKFPAVTHGESSWCNHRNHSLTTTFSRDRCGAPSALATVAAGVQARARCGHRDRDHRVGITGRSDPRRSS